MLHYIRTYLSHLVQLGYKSEVHGYKLSIDKLTFLHGQLTLGNSCERAMYLTVRAIYSHTIALIWYVNVRVICRLGH